MFDQEFGFLKDMQAYLHDNSDNAEEFISRLDNSGWEIFFGGDDTIVFFFKGLMQNHPFLFEKYFNIIEKMLDNENKVIKCFEAFFKYYPRVSRFIYERGYITNEQLHNEFIKTHNFNSHVFFLKEERTSFMFDTESLSGIKEMNWISQLEKDNYALYHDHLVYGFEKGSIQYILKYDEDKDLLNSVSSPNFNVHQSIENNVFEWSFQDNESKMLEFASFFGSIKCFRILISLGASISDITFQQAVVGGNLDIINQIKLQINPDSDIIYWAARSGNSLVIEWAKEFCKDILNVSRSLQTGNLSFFLHSLTMGGNINDEYKIALYVMK